MRLTEKYANNKLYQNPNCLLINHIVGCMEVARGNVIEEADLIHHMLRLSWSNASSLTASDRFDTFIASDAAIPPMPPTIWL